MTRPTFHHIPVCRVCQPIEILSVSKGRRGEVDFRRVDINKRRVEAARGWTP